MIQADTDKVRDMDGNHNRTNGDECCEEEENETQYRVHIIVAS